MTTQWETVIGLEIHTQLATKSKIFSGASTAYGAEPNTQACAVDLGLPGVLPVLNEEAVRMAVTFGLAIDAHIAPHSIFARKNYFYPDLPKGYQISQMDLPIVGNGHLDIEVDDETKRIGITRAHLEEDAGKSLHESFHGMTGIDLNRAGTPLLEIVSEPDMRSAKEAVAYMRKLHELVRYLEICDGNMQEGSFRCDANVSVRPKGQAEFGTRAEIKNINSFKFVEKAINHEIERQIEVIENGGKVVQETRLYDANKDETRSMRSKEEANDYRYFPDPDLLPVVISDEFKETVKATLPELPHAKKQRFIEQYSIKQESAEILASSKQRFISQYCMEPENAAILTSSKELANLYEELAKLTLSKVDMDSAIKVFIPADEITFVTRSIQEEIVRFKIFQMSTNWLTGDVLGALNKASLEIADCPISAERLAGLLKRIADNTISGRTAKQVFDKLWNGTATADEIIEQEGLKQITDTGAIEAIVDKVIAANPGPVEQYLSGKDKALMALVGQIMKETQGKANPGEVNKMLIEKLKG